MTCFFKILIASRWAVCFSLQRITLPKVPFPSTFRNSKSSNDCKKWMFLNNFHLYSSTFYNINKSTITYIGSNLVWFVRKKSMNIDCILYFVNFSGIPYPIKVVRVAHTNYLMKYSKQKKAITIFKEMVWSNLPYWYEILQIVKSKYSRF